PCNPARRDGSRYPKAVEDYRRPRRFALVGGAHSTSFVIDEEFCHAPKKTLRLAQVREMEFLSTIPFAHR
ncbi:MAG: hypothetical protein K9N62_02450, partial [Verrucomicrobia bacterium]|nr:hypothetical protein [Verrucomicrobiota bacterium]